MFIKAYCVVDVMEIILYVHLIGKSSVICPICLITLNTKGCRIAVYANNDITESVNGHKKKKRKRGKPVYYALVALPYCKPCGLFYARKRDVVQIEKNGEYKVWTNTHPQYDDKVAADKTKSSKTKPKKQKQKSFVIGHAFRHTGDSGFYGDGHGKIVDFDKKFVYVKFDSIGNKVFKFELTPYLMSKYRFINEQSTDFFMKIAEENKEAKIRAKAEKERLQNVDWTVVETSDSQNPQKVYLCYNIMGCQISGHALEDVRAKVLTLDKNSFVFVNAKCCSECNEYFIHHKSYEGYVEKHGPLVLRPMAYSRGGSLTLFGGTFVDLNPKSLLNLYGYKATAGTTDDWRQKKLVSIIEFGLMRKVDIISHLESLLGMLDNNYNHFEANKKRQRDLMFLNDYEIERQREVFGVIVRRAEKYRGRVVD